MVLLLDTHLLVWSVHRPERLSGEARRLIADADNTPAFSSACIWEVAIKTARGRPSFRVDAAELRSGLLASGYREIAVTGDHAIAVGGLPPLHKDPFDRLLIAQAAVEGATLLTADAEVARYGGPVRLVG
jgi:PIN domain nuclease of toxin-antitoxin system